MQNGNKSSNEQESYSDIGNSDISWRIVAESLLFCSDLLHKHGPISKGIVIYPVAQMLRGMYVECLLKVAARYSGEDIVKEGKPILKNHDLLNLSTKVDIKFSEEENNIFKDLTSYIQMGRYPVPSNIKFMKKTRKLVHMKRISSDKITAQISIWSKDQEDSFKKLEEKLKSFLENPQNDHSEQKLN